MKNMFFVKSVRQELADHEILEQVNREVLDIGLVPLNVCFGLAVCQGNSGDFKRGCVVKFEDEESAMRAAFHLKERLCAGTYLLPLNRQLKFNQVYHTYLDYNPGATLAETARRWSHLAGLVQGMYGVYVPAFMFEDSVGIRIAGNINVQVSENPGRWREAIAKIICCMNMGENTYILPPVVSNIN